MMEPFAESTCRLCRTASAKIRFTDDSRVIDVDCPKCGSFRVEIPGYHITLDELTSAQRLEIASYIEAKRKEGDESPIVTLEYLHELVHGPNGPLGGAATIDESGRPA